MSGLLYGRLLRRYRLGNDALSRREMLKRTLAASAGMLLSCQVGPFSSFGADVASRKRIVLVGAGFAGLACAYELSAAGVAMADGAEVCATGSASVGRAG